MNRVANTPPALTVSELNRDARMLLESHFDVVVIEGEIGDFTAASSGHWYFTLKDDSAQVRCAMFRRANRQVRVRPAKGDLVRLRARVSLYEGRGEFQLIGEHLEPAGDGALQLAFEQLKARLAAEGLFAPEHKRPVPDAAQHIGVVTSATGAALHDILSVLARRSPGTRVAVFPVAVQGEAAAPAIVAAIAQANHWSAQQPLPLELLIVGRGGGSLEDLWAFNEEPVARAIAGSALPVVSAVGHEVDFSIADFVADLRAPTPSAAAELVTRDWQDDAQRLDGFARHLQRQLAARIRAARLHLDHLARRLRSPAVRLSNQQQELARQRQRLRRSMDTVLRQRRSQLDTTRRRLVTASPARRLADCRRDLLGVRRDLSQAMAGRLARARVLVDQQRRLLDALSPVATLGRGYAIVQDSNGKVVRRHDDVPAGAGIRIRLAEGRLGARVESREEG